MILSTSRFRALLRSWSPRRFPFQILPLLALAASLLWLPSAEPARAQSEDARPKLTVGPNIISSPASGDAYGAGETIRAAVTFSEAVTVSGKPRLRLKVGDKNRWLRYDRSDEDGERLIFAYTVKSKDADANGVSIPKNRLKLNGGSIADGDGNAAKLKHPEVPDQPGHKVRGSPEAPASEPTPTSAPEPTPTSAPEPTPTPAPEPTPTPAPEPTPTPAPEPTPTPAPEPTPTPAPEPTPT
ncbi:MAG: hypothetical protein OXU21_00325, partial [Chloroflexota bacterium]|nr:hypothetical protein [Chloroflexota bacterium]